MGVTLVGEGITLSYMKLKDGLHRDTLQNTVYGGSDLNECPVYALLWYLFHVRKVFVSGSLQDVIQHNRYELVEGAEDNYLLFK